MSVLLTESEKVLEALKRSGQIARKRAIAYNHKIAIVRDGEVVHVDPREEGADTEPLKRS